MDRQQLASAPTQELCDTFEQLAALAASVQRYLLTVVAELDRREAWRDDGAWSMGTWIAERAGVSRRTGAEQARVAAALESLPAIAETFGSGSLSYDKVRALTWFAEPDCDASLAASAPSWPVVQLERLARRAREVAPVARHPELRFLRDPDGRLARINGRLWAEDAELVRRALESRLPRGKDRPPYAHGLADALVQVCGGSPDGGGGFVVLHVDAATLSGGRGLAELEDGSRLPAQVVRRLACDARIQPVIEELRDGLLGPRPIGIGRASRVVTPALMKLLKFRDMGCVFPGCERRTFLQAHHVITWLDGGRTDLDNLVCLCGFHHKLVHEGGWRITGHPERQIHFVRPDGSVLRSAPVPMRREVRDRILGPPPDTS